MPHETLFFRQIFEMKSLKNGISLTVNRWGVPPPFLLIPSELKKNIDFSFKIGYILNWQLVKVINFIKIRL